LASSLFSRDVDIVTSAKSRSTLRVHEPEELEETNLMSLSLLLLLSSRDIVSAVSIEVEDDWISNGFTRNAPFNILHTAENSDVIVTPGIF
jgi:hypothetical protein